MNSSESSETSKKRRAAAACGVCHSRKVRCDIVSSGSPCSNCRRDEVECILHVSARGRHHRVRGKKQKDAGRSSPALPGPALGPGPGLRHSPDRSQAHLHRRLGSQVVDLTPADDPSRRADEETQSNVDGYSLIVDTPKSDRLLEPFYVGEQQSLRFIFNVARDKTLATNAHFLVPQKRKAALSPAASTYLHAIGAFDVETPELRSELINLFFQYVHPTLPVVEPTDFFHRYETGGPACVNPLLLQSMFLAASTFVSPEGLRRSEMPSVIALRSRFYQRAKALYDFDNGNGKLCLIQAVLLIGYWFSNAQDRSDNWHWTGVAIGLSQSIGLHRSPGHSNIPLSHRRLWKRIWWCCFCRDRYVALGMGRPTRISLDDCDVDDVTVDDLISSAVLAPTLTPEHLAIVMRCNNVAPLFLDLVKLSKISGEILCAQYRPKVELLSSQELIQCEAKIHRWHDELDPSCRLEPPDHETNDTPIGLRDKYWLQVQYHVLIILLYRPLIFGNPSRASIPDESAESWKKCASAASNLADCFRQIVEHDLVYALPPESVSMLVVHVPILFLSKCWASGLKQHLAGENLNLALLLLEELGRLYLASQFALSYFRRAFEKIGQSGISRLGMEEGDDATVVPSGRGHSSKGGQVEVGLTQPEDMSVSEDVFATISGLLSPSIPTEFGFPGVDDLFQGMGMEGDPELMYGNFNYL